jgi:PAS domain S-box-containing protein
MPEIPIKILLIENNSGDAVFIQKLLGDVNGESFKIKWVDCLESAFSQISKTDYDVILLDLNLPDGTGLDTITVVYDKAPQIPIVVLTGIKDNLIALDSVKRGAQDYLSKEIINEDNLSRVIRYAIERNRIQNESKAREDKYTELFEKSNDAIFILDLDSNILDVNGRALTILGYKKSELLSTKISELHPHYASEISKSAFENVKTKGHTVFEIDFKCKDEKVITTEVSSSIFKIHGKKLVQGIVRDITQRKIVENKLQLQDKALLSSVNGIVITELGGRIIWVNPAFTKLTGYESKEVIGKNPRILKSDLQDSKYYKNLWDTILSGKVWQGELINLRKDGKLYFEEQTITPVRNDNGEITHFVGIKTDITERKYAEKALRQSEQKYRTLFNESKDVIYISSVDGKFLDVNPVGVELFGYNSVEELKRIDLAEQLYFNPEDRQKFQKELGDKGYVRDHELELKRKDGEKLSVLITSRAVRDDQGNVTSYRGFIRDITKQKQLEQQLLQAQKMEAIGTLAGGIAHDFNNILGAILGYTELTNNILANSNGNDIVKRNLEQVNKAGLRAKDLVQQILTFSRKTTHKPKPLQIELIVKEALKLLRASTPATVGIQQNIDNNCGLVLADPTQIHQVIINLCTNAVDAVRGSGGKIEVGLNKVEINGNTVFDNVSSPWGEYVQLTVSDNGKGMDEETIARIFDPFFTTKEAGEGTGLGLSVVHGIVKNHNGEITVWSELGKGSRFNIYLPALKTQKVPEQAKIDKLLRGTESILFVDDEEALVQVNIQLLEKLGYRVTGNTNSHEALAAFKESPDKFDLVISDQTMPGMTGVELATKLMEIRQDVPIILITGYSDVINRKKAKEMGIRELVMKPILASDLSRTIRNAIDNQNGDKSHG